jgi:hypothetical protein
VKSPPFPPPPPISAIFLCCKSAPARYLELPPSHSACRPVVVTGSSGSIFSICPECQSLPLLLMLQLWPGSSEEPQVLPISLSMPSDPTANSHLEFSLTTHFHVPSSDAQQRDVYAQVSTT